MEQSIETTRYVDVSFLVTARLPKGVLVRGAWVVTDAGEIARLYGDEVLQEAMQEAGFHSIQVRSIATAKGPTVEEQARQEGPIDTTTAHGRKLARERAALMPPR